MEHGLWVSGISSRSGPVALTDSLAAQAYFARSKWRFTHRTPYRAQCAPKRPGEFKRVVVGEQGRGGKGENRGSLFSLKSEQQGKQRESMQQNQKRQDHNSDQYAPDRCIKHPSPASSFVRVMHEASSPSCTNLLAQQSEVLESQAHPHVSILRNVFLPVRLAACAASCCSAGLWYRCGGWDARR